MSAFLYKACEECVSEAGLNDKDLITRLHDYIHENYEEKQKAWNYALIDRLIEKWSK